VPVPRASSRVHRQAYQAAKDLACEPVVVKAQIHAAARKGGGVKLAKSADKHETSLDRCWP